MKSETDVQNSKPKFNPKQDRIYCKKSSLAIEIQEDNKYELKFYVFNRRTRSIIGQYRIPLLQHCRDSMQNIEPILAKKMRRRAKK